MKKSIKILIILTVIILIIPQISLAAGGNPFSGNIGKFFRKNNNAIEKTFLSQQSTTTVSNLKLKSKQDNLTLTKTTTTITTITSITTKTTTVSTVTTTTTTIPNVTTTNNSIDIGCNGKYGTKCPAGQNFYCPASGDPNCVNNTDIGCNGKYGVECLSGQRFICPSNGNAYCEYENTLSTQQIPVVMTKPTIITTTIIIPTTTTIIKTIQPTTTTTTTIPPTTTTTTTTIPPTTTTKSIDCSNYKAEKDALDEGYAERGLSFSGARNNATNVLNAKYPGCG